MLGSNSRAAICGVVLLCVLAAAASQAPPRLIVDLRGVEPPLVLAAQVCAGLLNREEHNDTVAGPAYTIMNSGHHDLEWLADFNMPVKNFTPLAVLMTHCLSSPTVTKGYIRYNFSSQQVAVPNIITLAAMLDAVPLEDGSPYLLITPKPALVFDFIAQFGVGANVTSLVVTTYMFDRFAATTTGMSMMDPGYDYSNEWKDADPPLTGLPDLGMTDFVVKFRIFNFFLVNGCIPGAAEHVLMDRMVAPNSTSWPQPVAVFGYNSAWKVFGGAPYFEAQTTCVSHTNIGECCTLGFNNLAYFSRAAPITTPMAQNPQPKKRYNASKTYIALLMGDGDNTLYLKTWRAHMMKDRVARCTADPASCFPLMWTFSSWMLTWAPEIVRWYYNSAATTAKDYFMFPPSGYIYSYPSMFPAEAQDNHIREMELRARLMNASATNTWESFLNWEKGLTEFYPKYARTGVISGVFTTNVPFMIPILQFGLETYKVLRDNSTGGNHTTIIFNSQEWRGTNASLAPPFGQLQYSTPDELAASINGFPRGTIESYYCTTDGGFHLDDLFDLVALLGEHVEVVTAEQLVDLARQRSNV
jgi:hypothetical protein